MELVDLDRKYVWHPFTQMKHEAAIPIIKGKGATLYAENGDAYLDAISSWWVNLHGHAHPYIIKKITEQARLLEHVLFAGFTHPSAIRLAQRLLPLLPGMTKVFYTDNGSTAVEAAIKLAIQYWHNKNIPRFKVICFKGSYHGDTLGAMSAAGKNSFNQPFWNYLFDVEAIDAPDTGNSYAQLDRLLSKIQPACFIFEPLVLGSGGMRMYDVKTLDALLLLCQQHQVLTIADEVMTGFGRTGPLFACGLLSNQPDLICLSKGLTGGFLPLGATACQEHIYQAFYADEKSKAFLHGHSYTANPLACASALASLDLLLKDDCSLKRKWIAKSHQGFCNQWRKHPRLRRCESLGTILALEYNSAASYFNPIREELYAYFIKNGLLLRPLGNVVYVMPPYCLTEEELNKIYHHLIYTLEEMPWKNC